MIPPVDPAAVEQVAALLDYNGATGGVADRDVAAMLRALSSALTTATEEKQSLNELRRLSNEHVMSGLRRIAKALGDDEPQDLGAVHVLASLVEFVIRERAEAHQHLGTALRFVKEAGFDDQIQAARAYYEAHKAT